MKDKTKGESNKTPPTKSGIDRLTSKILGSSRCIMTLALGFGLFFWVVDAILDYFVFFKGYGTFMELLITRPPSHEVYIRLIILACFIVFGVIVSSQVSKRKRTEERIEHLNRVLRAIRNINQLIIKEKNRNALIQKACKILVETRSYYNAWIVLLDEKGKYLTSAKTGMDKAFAPMKKLMGQGKWTECGKRALKQKELIITKDPKKECLDCPLATAYAKRGAFTVCLVHHDRIYGLLSASIPKSFLKEKQEQELFREVAGDIALALHTIKLEEETVLAEKELRNSYRQWETTFDAMIDSVFLSNMNGKILKCNSSTKFLLGKSYQEIIGHHCWQFIHGTSSPIEKYPLMRMKKTLKRESMQLHLGNNWFEYSVDPIFDSTNKLFGAVHIIKDINKRKKTEEALRESENRLKILFESAPDAYYLNDFEGRFIDGNKAVEKLLGYSKRELLGKKFVDAGILPMDQTEKAQNVLAKNINGKSAGPDEYTLKRKDGLKINVEILTHPIKIGVEDRILGIARDITERKQNEEELEKHRGHLEELVKKRTSELERSQQALSFILGDVNESRDELQDKTDKLNSSLKEVEKARDNIDAILKSIADGLIVTDLDNRIISMNLVAEDLLKISLREVLNKPLDSVIKDKKLAEKFKVTVSKAEKGYQFDFEFSTENTKYPRIFNARISNIKGKKGKTTGIIIVFSDVSQEREINRMKTEFISTAAHELRTPLTSIQGFSEILKTRDDLKEKEKKRFVDYINNQAVNLGNIIGDLLDISRLESGLGFSLKRQKCKIFKAISNVVSSFKISFPSHTFSLSLPDREKEIIADREKMEQVMDNLLSNAVKYSPEGGKIRITVKQEKGEYQITVEDQGMGMTPRQVGKVFDKFYRVDSSDTAIKGTGLGLSIVKHIIEAHNGQIWIDSQPGKGTRVRFTIPLESVKANKKKLNHKKEAIKGK